MNPIVNNIITLPQPWNSKTFVPWRKSHDSILKSRDITLLTKVHIVKAMAFPLVMYRHEIWTIKKAEHQRIDAFRLWCWRRLLRVPWPERKSNQSIVKGNQSWMFIWKTDAEAETLILWSPYVKNWLIGKDPDAGIDRRQEEKGTTEDEMVGWHCRLNGHEFEQTLGHGEGQGSLVCCSLWGRKESDTTEWIHNNNSNRNQCTSPHQCHSIKNKGM